MTAASWATQPPLRGLPNLSHHSNSMSRWVGFELPLVAPLPVAGVLCQSGAWHRRIMKDASSQVEVRGVYLLYGLSVTGASATNVEKTYERARIFLLFFLSDERASSSIWLSS